MKSHLGLGFFPSLCQLHIYCHYTIIGWGWARYHELSKPRSVLSAEAEGWGRLHRHEVLIIHDIIRKPNSIIVLFYIFHIIHPQKQKRSVQPFCFWGEHAKGHSNQADFELDMINAISAADIAFIMSITSYCELIECTRPIRFFIVSLMYNN